MANNITLCLYVIKVSYTMVLIFCMCRDSKGADYASKGWPPADGGKLLLHVYIVYNFGEHLSLEKRVLIWEAIGKFKI